VTVIIWFNVIDASP